MGLQEKLADAVKDAVQHRYDVLLEDVEITLSRKDVNAHLTVMVFPMLRHIKGNPAAIGEQIGSELKANLADVKEYHVVKGFLNLTLAHSALLAELERMRNLSNYGIKEIEPSKPAVVVEYSSPNTNKPLHLGHVRNNLLGYSVAEIIKATGTPVVKTQIINDRGIHICKSMVAWQKYGSNETPENSGIKGDHLVGKYYVIFDQKMKEQQSNLEEGQEAPILKEARDMLRKWEAGDTEVRNLWQTMNSWVYQGFEQTYTRLGVDFDSIYYESDTYLLGKEVIEKGLETGVFYKKDDGSVWCDLTEDGLDEKLVLRSDGTAVYMTQDLGTAIKRAEDNKLKGMVYTVGNEQDYHFKVLFLILHKLGYDWAKNLYHLSYGMVELPKGKMKSREGTVVDADDLLEEMHQTAKEIALQQGKLDGLSEGEKHELYEMIGLGALKYFMLKIDPKKGIKFDPTASVDFQGNTGPFVQYAHARITSILNKADFKASKLSAEIELSDLDMALILHLQQFPPVIDRAAKEHSPALVANYVYELVRLFNSFYQNVPKILQEQDRDIKQFRLTLCSQVADVIKTACGLLGIEVPDQM
jgi:arginyl-tRNA synthetase